MTKAKSRLSLLRFGLGLVRRLSPGYIPLALARALFAAAQPVVVLFFSASILNELAGAKDTRAIIIYAAATICASFALTVLRALLEREVNTRAGGMEALTRIYHMQAERFAQMDFVYAEDSALTEKLAAMDVRARGNNIGLISLFFRPAALVESVLSAVFSVALLFGPLSTGAAISGAPAAVLCGMFAAGILCTMKMRGVEMKMLNKIYAENAKANTALPYYGKYLHVDGAAKEIRLYDQAHSLGKLLEQSFPSDLWTRFFFKKGAMDGAGLAILAALGGAVYLLTGLNSLGGAVPVGSIVRTVGAVTVLATAVGTTMSLGSVIYVEADYLQTIREYLSLPDLQAKGARAVNRGDGHMHELEFRNVSFRYPGAQDFALEKLNLKLRAGQRLAVVGLNGSGKTTMIKLLCRLYDPDEGEILLDGVNIKEYDYGQYLSLFSVVFQDFALFPLELGKNVAAGGEYDEERVRDCLMRAGFSDRLGKMPDGLDTMLFRSYDEDGTQVSGGEAQKIALARALYKNAPVVVLDEPTAALDPVAEYEVYTTFDRMIGGKTAVFISHRLSSCRFCHDIAVFEGGRLIQRGSHEQLLAEKSGRYRDLWYAQASHYGEA